MAFGTKTNERPGTRAQVKYVRSSAYKAREVLNLIRNESYARASEILEFSDRGISDPIAKCLDSAVANAENNDGLDAEELYVSACYADEGPTLKRWRPRARGRATRIRKRTCHITIIVSRYSADELEVIRSSEAAKGTSSRSTAAASRRDRVQKSKDAAEARAEAHDHDHDHDHDDEDTAAAVVAGAGAGAAADAVADEAATDEAATEEAATEEAATDEAAADEAATDEAATEEAAADDVAPHGEGSHGPLPDDAMPDGYPIKGNADSMKYHEPDTRYYDATIAEVWFATAEAAEAAGFTAPGGAKKSDEQDDA